MNKKLFAFLSAVVLVSFIAVFAVAESTVATVGSTLCTNLQDAVNAYSTPATPIQLKANITEDITISKDVYLDLNGFDVTGKVCVLVATQGVQSQGFTDAKTAVDTAFPAIPDFA